MQSGSNPWDDLPWDKIPDHLRMPLQKYLEDGLEPGGFLRAVLENDLQGSMYRADDTNQLYLKEILDFCVWHLPSASWGSVEAVNDWMTRHKEQRMSEALLEAFTQKRAKHADVNG